MKGKRPNPGPRYDPREISALAAAQRVTVTAKAADTADELDIDQAGICSCLSSLASRGTFIRTVRSVEYPEQLLDEWHITHLGQRLYAKLNIQYDRNARPLVGVLSFAKNVKKIR